MKNVYLSIPFILTGIVVFHFSFVLISVIPFNPIKNDVSYIDRYIDPLFTQTWTLFAPDPITYNDALEIKLIFQNGEQSGWIDTTNPIIGEMHKNYLSPFNRMSRITQTISSQMLTQDELTLNYRDEIEGEEEYQDQIEQMDEYQMETLEAHKKLFLRYASSYAKSLFPERDDIEDIEMRLLHQESIPFSQRYQEEERVWEEIYRFDRKEIVEDVLPIF